MKNPLLASTLKLLAEQGKKGFYEGPIAESIIESTSKLGGFLTLDDLRKHDSEVVDPVSMELESDSQTGPLHLWEHPPNGQGIVAQMALGILAELERDAKIPKFTKNDHNSAK